MRKLFFLIMILVPSLAMSQSGFLKETYRDFGTWNTKISDKSEISISSIVTRERVQREKSDFSNMQYEMGEKYKFEIYLFSRSKVNNKNTNVIINNLKVFINDVEITSKQFPNGISTIVPYEGIVVYTYIIDRRDIDIAIKWGEIKIIE